MTCKEFRQGVEFWRDDEIYNVSTTIDTKYLGQLKEHVKGCAGCLEMAISTEWRLRPIKNFSGHYEQVRTCTI